MQLDYMMVHPLILISFIMHCLLVWWKGYSIGDLENSANFILHTVFIIQQMLLQILPIFCGQVFVLQI